MLNIQGLTKCWPGSDKGVHDLTLRVAPGQLCAFIGPNGAGKTTTLKAIAGIHSFDSGEVFIDGLSLRQQPLDCKSRLAYIPDDPDLYEYLTGIQYLSFIADVFGITAAQRQQRIGQYADAFELTGALGDLISSYSHGMKQKLALISAFLHQPRLLILDEPFVGLDPKAAVTLKAMMKQLCREGGAVFFSTHVLEVAEKLCDQVAILKDGRLIKSGAMAQVVGDSRSLEELFLEVAHNE